MMVTSKYVQSTFSKLKLSPPDYQNALAGHSVVTENCTTG